MSKIAGIFVLSAVIAMLVLQHADSAPAAFSMSQGIFMDDFSALDNRNIITTLANGTINCGGMMCSADSHGCQIDIFHSTDNRNIITKTTCLDRRCHPNKIRQSSEPNKHPHSSVSLTTYSCSV